MKKTFTLLFAIVSISVFSQPEISQSNIPVVGDVTQIAICSDPLDPGAAGAMQTWDMSNLTELEQQSFTYIQPAEGMKADSFPNANLCGVSWDNDHAYYRSTPTGLIVEGYATATSANDTAVIVYDDNEMIVELPYTFNHTFFNNFSGVSYLSGIGTFPFDGTLEFEADGYGTLVLPTGTYENVVRYHFSREQTNYFNGFPAGTTSKEQWAWVSEEYRFWLLLMEENFDGFNNTTLIWYDKNPYAASTDIANNSALKTVIYPNPAKKEQPINLVWDKRERATLSLINIDGSLIQNNQFNLEQGTNNIGYRIQEEGLYILKIKTADRNLTKKISVVN